MTMIWRLALAGAAAMAAVPAQAELLNNGGFEAAPNTPWRTDVTAPGGHVQSYSGGAVVTSQYLPGWRIRTPGESDLHRSPSAYALYPAAAGQGFNYFALNWSPAGGITLFNEIEQGFVLGNGATSASLSLLMTTEAGFAGSTLVASILDARGQVVAQSPTFTNTRGLGVWDPKQWTASGLAGGSYTLRLAGTGSGNAWDVLVDGVSLQQIGCAVPEPATWSMMILGFGLLGAAARRRRVRAAAITA